MQMDNTDIRFIGDLKILEIVGMHHGSVYSHRQEGKVIVPYDSEDHEPTYVRTIPLNPDD